MYYAIIYGILAALATWLIMYLDTKLLDNYKEKSTYLKVMVMTGFITAGIITFIGEENLGHLTSSLPRRVLTGGGGSGSGALSYIPEIREEIFTGPANF